MLEALAKSTSFSGKQQCPINNVDVGLLLYKLFTVVQTLTPNLNLHDQISPTLGQVTLPVLDYCIIQLFVQRFVNTYIYDSVYATTEQ